MNNSIWLCVLFSVCLQLNDATKCKPDSTFKVDCNTCTCSSSGTAYSCENKLCEKLSYEDKYEVIRQPNGRIILQPKAKPLSLNDAPQASRVRKATTKDRETKESSDKNTNFDDWSISYKEAEEPVVKKGNSYETGAQNSRKQNIIPLMNEKEKFYKFGANNNDLEDKDGGSGFDAGGDNDDSEE